MIYVSQPRPQPENPMKAEKNHLETAYKAQNRNRNRGFNLLRNLFSGNQR